MSSESESTASTERHNDETAAGQLSRRLRGVVYLIAGLFAAALAVYLLLRPGDLRGMHPLPLVVLLGISLLVAVWQARRLLR